MISSVSFGKHIPIMQSCIKNTKNNNSVPVTLSEVDCMDYEDVETMFKACPNWKYTRHIAADIHNKYCCNYNLYDIEYPYNFYVLKDSEENIIGFCETEDCDSFINLEYLETKQNDKFKYAGQTILAMLGKILQKQNKDSIFIPNPASGAIDFYTQKCGFWPVDKDREWGSLIIDEKAMSALISDVEAKTNSKIVDITG
ncbi:hypothetical protein IJ182_05180 [bacterium]|nr:hypothetical protein [bacterium]